MPRKWFDRYRRGVLGCADPGTTQRRLHTCTRVRPRRSRGMPLAKYVRLRTQLPHDARRNTRRVLMLTQERHPLRTEAVVAASRSYEWLGRQSSLADLAAFPSLARALDWLLAAWICERGLGIETATNILSRRGARELALRVDNQTQSEAFSDFFTCDAMRVILAHHVLSCHEVRCSKLDAFISGLAASLDTRVQQDPDDVDLFEARFLVSLSGLGSAPGLLPLSERDLPTTLGLLQANEQQIQTLATQAAAASAYGTARAIIDPAVYRIITAVIPVWVIDF